MIDYEYIENQFLDLLESSGLGEIATLLPMPENPDGFQITGEKPTILVCYDMSLFKDKALAYGEVTEDDVHIQLEVHARKLRGENGLYKLLSIIKSAITGQSLKTTLEGGKVVTQGDPISLKEGGFPSPRFKNGFHTYVLIATSKNYFSKDIPEETAALIQQFRLEEQYEGTETVTEVFRIPNEDFPNPNE